MLKDWTFTLKALRKYRDYVIKQARANLTRKGMGAHTRLYKSLRGIVAVKQGRDTLGRFTTGMQPQLTFFMEKYGDFVDQGVKGTDDNDSNRAAKPYKFDKRKKYINLGAAESFIKRRGIRAKRGMGGRKSLKFAIARVIHRRGIKRSLFLTRPLQLIQKRGADMVAKGAAEDITNNLVKDLKLYFKDNEYKS